MRLGIRLGLLAACAWMVGCGDDSSEDNGGTSSEESRAIAEALTEGIEFENGLLRRGSIPDSNGTVSLSQDDDVLRLVPGESSLMSLGVENADEDDPVESALLQFEDADQHIEVSTDSDAGAGDGISLGFAVDESVCEAFCNKIFTIRMIQAVRMRSGDVSQHLLRTFELDCREHGRASLCEDEGGDDPDGGASAGRGGRGGSGGGSGGTGGGGSSTTTVAAELRSAIAQVNVAACMCSEPGMMTSTCTDAPYPSTAVTCIYDAVAADAALGGPASCVTTQLQSATSACSCAATACYGDAIAAAHTACEADPEFETALEDCQLSTMPSASGDAGASP